MVPRVSLVKPRLLPVHLESSPKRSFSVQLEHLERQLGDLVEWLAPAPIEAAAESDATAVVTPDLSGVAYRKLEAFRAITRPILVITSEFATVSMWDWEIRDHLRRRGVDTIAPLSLQESQDICRALAVKETLSSATMLAYQDEIGAGMQPDIFKRFFWWEDECVAAIERRFGVAVEHRSFKGLQGRADSIGDARARAELERVGERFPMPGLGDRAQLDAMRLYCALADELDESGNVIAAGINCLNESPTSNTTPCMAWNLLFEERGLMWGCEADLMSMLTEFIVNKALDVPAIMSNLYPFAIGQAALKHERIPYFPEVDGRPEDHVLVAHCGYFALMPKVLSTRWEMKPRVLEIVDPNAHALDAQLPEGPTMLIKLAGTMDTLVTSQAELVEYVRYEDSDCLNGGVLRVRDGHRFVENLPSHHTILASGDLERRVDVVAGILGLDVQRI
jgi:hypothetical protein